MIDKTDINSSISMAFVGDVSFGDCLFCQGFGIRSIARKTDSQHFFSGVSDRLQQADFTFCNLETVLSKNGEDDSRLASVDLRGDPESIESLRLAGFSVVNVANNHSVQHGPAPFNETVELLQRNQMAVVGLKSHENWHCAPVVMEKQGVKIGFLGYSFVHDRQFSTMLPYADGDDEKILTDIVKLRQSVDVLVVSMHWGLEFMDYPSTATVQFAHTMVDAGVDIVIGHHPHVLQGIENYKGRIIAYSLGNFLFDMLWSEDYRQSMILEISYRPGKSLAWSMTSVRIGRDGSLAVLSGKQGANAQDRLNSLSEKIIRAEHQKNLSQHAYEAEYDRKMLSDRIRSYLYFLANFHSYRKKYLLQQLKRTVSSRVEDFQALLGRS